MRTVCSTVTVADAHAARGCYDCERAKLPRGVEVEEDVYGFDNRMRPHTEPFGSRVLEYSHITVFSVLS